MGGRRPAGCPLTGRLVRVPTIKGLHIKRLKVWKILGSYNLQERAAVESNRGLFEKMKRRVSLNSETSVALRLKMGMAEGVKPIEGKIKIRAVTSKEIWDPKKTVVKFRNESYNQSISRDMSKNEKSDDACDSSGMAGLYLHASRQAHKLIIA